MKVDTDYFAFERRTLSQERGDVRVVIPRYLADVHVAESRRTAQASCVFSGSATNSSPSPGCIISLRAIPAKTETGDEKQRLRLLLQLAHNHVRFTALPTSESQRPRLRHSFFRRYAPERTISTWPVSYSWRIAVPFYLEPSNRTL